jgi:hypothetical protein
MARHLDKMVEVFGEKHGCHKFRKVALEYAKRFGPVTEFNRRIVQLNCRAEFDEIVAVYRRWRAQFLDENEQLLPQYAPRPLAPSFAKEVAAGIRVPAGPNELW